MQYNVFVALEFIQGGLKPNPLRLKKSIVAP